MDKFLTGTLLKGILLMLAGALFVFIIGGARMTLIFSAGGLLSLLQILWISEGAKLLILRSGTQKKEQKIVSALKIIFHWGLIGALLYVIISGYREGAVWVVIGFTLPLAGLLAQGIVAARDKEFYDRT